MLLFRRALLLLFYKTTRIRIPKNHSIRLRRPVRQGPTETRQGWPRSSMRDSFGPFNVLNRGSRRKKGTFLAPPVQNKGSFERIESPSSMTVCLFVTRRMTATKWRPLTLNGRRNKMNIDVAADAVTIRAFVGHRSH